MKKSEYRRQVNRAAQRRAPKRVSLPKTRRVQFGDLCPERKPRERSMLRVDDGFVLYGGWQLQYEPTVERRERVMTSPAK